MASLAGRTSFVVASILTLLVISYDIFTKEMPVAGPMIMAACRGMNLLLGMSSALSWSVFALVFPVITFAYVFSLTTLSHFEVDGGLGGKGRIVSLSLFLVVFVLLIMKMTHSMAADGLIYLGILILFAGLPLLIGFLKPTPDHVGRAVKFLILGIPLLDAVYVSGLHGWAYGIPVALCMVPSMVHFPLSLCNLKCPSTKQKENVHGKSPRKTGVVLSQDPEELLDLYFLDMRSALLETAAALDRIERAGNGSAVFRDPRIRKLTEACDILKNGKREQGRTIFKPLFRPFGIVGDLGDPLS